MGTTACLVSVIVCRRVGLYEGKEGQHYSVKPHDVRDKFAIDAFNLLMFDCLGM